MSTAIFWVGPDVHKDSVTIAVVRDCEREPLRVHGLPCHHEKIRRYIQRLTAWGALRINATPPVPVP